MTTPPPATYWQNWHNQYADPESDLSARLAAVQERIRVALDEAPAGPIRVISLCAGDGRDLLGVLADHPRRDDVIGRLVELDPNLAEAARTTAAAIPGIEVITGDAAQIDNYAPILPADIVLTCGVFGNITDEDIRATIAAHRSLCAPGATVIWTRGRYFSSEPGRPDLVPTICDWFTDSGFDLVWLSDADVRYGVGVHRYTGSTEPIAPGTCMFTFIRGS